MNYEATVSVTPSLREPELLRQLELQRRYLDFLASTVEYLLQELEEVKHLLPAASRSSSIASGKLVRPHRPAELGKSATSLHWQHDIG